MLRLRTITRKRTSRPDLETMEGRELLTAMLQITPGVSTAVTTSVNQLVSYTLQATNTSTAGEALTNVQIFDTVPAGFVFVPGASTPGLVENGNIIESAVVPTLAVGDSTPPVLIGGYFSTAAPAPGPPLVSRFLAAGMDPGGATTSDTSRLAYFVNPVVDLGLTTAASPTAVNPGQPVTYTLTVSNALGQGDATHVAVTDTIPAGATFVPASSSPGLTLSADGSTIVDLIGNLASGASQTITIVFKPDVSVQSSLLFNTAAVTGLENDVNLSNNKSSDSSVTVNPAVNVSITKAVSTVVPGLIGANQGLTYTLTVNNTGPANATNVVVTDNLPAGVLTSLHNIVASGGGVVALNGNQITVTYPTFTAGSSQTVAITALTAGPFTRNTNLVNTATVLPNQYNLSTQTSATASTLLDVVSPRVVNVVRYGYHNVPTVLVVQFSKPLNPATVNSSDFTVLDYGNVHRPFWWLNPVRVPIARVVYDTAHNQAFLYPTALLPLTHTYAVIVSGVSDLVGHPLPATSTTFINQSSVRGLIAPQPVQTRPALKPALLARAKP